jgi:type I restriction enzyme S subunit
MPVRYILPKNFVLKQLEANDLVAEISGGSPTQSTGRIALITRSLLSRYDKPMICTNFCKAMKPITGFAAFIYYYWQYLYDLNVLFSYENGTTGIKNLNISGFVEVESIVIPDDPTATKFNEMVMGFQEMVFSLGKQNEQLALTRDALLPKLMSGEIEVPVEG